jgi:hypothetical protein
MADTTTVMALPFPEGSDANDVPADMQALAERLDEAPGIESLTSAEISALAAGQKPAGRVVYNSTTSKLQVSNGSTFANIDAAALLLAGGTMAGNIAMGSNKVTGLAAASANGDAVRYEQLVATDARRGARHLDGVDAVADVVRHDADIRQRRRRVALHADRQDRHGQRPGDDHRGRHRHLPHPAAGDPEVDSHSWRAASGSSRSTAAAGSATTRWSRPTAPPTARRGGRPDHPRRLHRRDIRRLLHRLRQPRAVVVGLHLRGGVTCRHERHNQG